MARFPEEALRKRASGDPGVTYPRAFTLYEADLELVKWLAGELGCSRSEVVRTAIRMMALRMNAVELIMASQGRAEIHE